MSKRTECIDEILTKLGNKISHDEAEKLRLIKSCELVRWIASVIEHLDPQTVFINTGSRSDYEYIRKRALENKEEIASSISPLHTVHFDGPLDIARDKGNTRIIVDKGMDIPLVNIGYRDELVPEIMNLLKGIMKNKEMFIGFYCFGPRNSVFTIHGVQITDSAYVMHSENILYRNCFEDFTRRVISDYMKFIHSSGERDQYGWSKNTDKRRIYIDRESLTTYSINTQYAGNTVGLKKLSLRLCIYKGFMEGWLCEHMFIIGMNEKEDKPVYFAGAFPAGCGKTSTTMMADLIIGDDLAIIKNIAGEARAVNPEIGIFGIIDGINPIDDPELYKLLTSRDSEIIFSNVLLTHDGNIWWKGKPEEPRSGLNYSGEWWPGKTDRQGNPIPPSHPNARFTTSIFHLEKIDEKINDPNGVPISALIFGGRDSNTWVPVEEAFDWTHGIVTKGASIESERTPAVLGKPGVLEFNPFAILDFLSISLNDFIDLHLKFGASLESIPRIYSVNYFLTDEKGVFLSEKRDKKVWLRWIERRVRGEVDAVETPTGFIPIYQDLVSIFDKELGKGFSESLYEKLFTIRARLLLEKNNRILSLYASLPETPSIVMKTLEIQKQRIKEAIMMFGEFISPFKLDKK